MEKNDSLRGFLSLLEEQGELAYVEKEVDPHFEASAVLYKVAEAGGPALFFKKVKGKSVPLVGNICASRRRLALALNTTEEKIRATFLAGTQGNSPSRRLAQGACQEVIEEKVDLDKLPIITGHERDAAPYITAGVVVANHPVTGVPNLSINRMQVIGPDRVAISTGAGSDLGAYLMAAEGRPLPVAVVLGLHPVYLLVASAKLPIEVNEYTVIGALLGKPVETVKALTSDLDVPANAEIVLEGEIRPEERVPEGPFGEFPGYYSYATLDPKGKPVIAFRRMTHRREPTCPYLLCGPSPAYEASFLQPLFKEVEVYSACRAACPAVHEVRVDNSRYFCGIQLKGDRRPGDVALVMAAAFSVNDQAKYVVVVDDDVNINNPADVWWAVATRVDPTRDVYTFARQRMVLLDPVTSGTCDKLGFDATIPLEADRNKFQRTLIPGLEEIKISDYVDVSPRPKASY